LIRLFRCVAAFTGLAHVRDVRSRARLSRALRSSRLNQPQFIGEELGMAEAGVALSAVGVEDLQRRPPPWWAGAVARDDHLRSLADDVASEADPRSPGELQPDAGRLADGRGQPARSLGAGARRWLEHDERDPGPSRKRGETAESIAESRSRNARPSAGQVDDEQVHRPAGEQRAGDRQALLGLGRGQDDEPLRLHAAGDCLHGIERRREVQPGRDRACRLGLRDEPQGQRGPAARDVATDREAHPARDAAGAEDGIELGEAGRVDAVGIDRRLALRIGVLERHGGERADHLAGEARSATSEAIPAEPGRRRTPARSKGRQRRCEVGRGDGHGSSIEQMFE
jgi:hypothetical protein